jgi:replication factor A1
MNSIDITLKVVDVKIILKVPWIAESIVGDETGVIVLKTVRRDQAKRVRHGKTIRLRNARVEVPNGSMKLMVRRAEDIEDAPDAAFTVKLDNNLSLIEWDRIDVAV